MRKIATGSFDPEFDLERRAHAVANVDAADPEEKEHRRGVGGRDHRAKDQPVHPRQAEDQPGGEGHQPGRHRDAERGEDAGRPGGDAERRAAGGKARIEQDDGERNAAHEKGGTAVVELDAEGAVLAGEQADGQEDEKEGSPEAEADEAGENRGDHQGGADEYRQIHRLEHEFPPSQVMRSARSAPCPCYCPASVADQWLGPWFRQKESDAWRKA